MNIRKLSFLERNTCSAQKNSKCFVEVNFPHVCGNEILLTRMVQGNASFLVILSVQRMSNSQAKYLSNYYHR